MVAAASPIGIFDSGLGGLTVFKALRALLPRESLIYLGDTARVPYGTKSAPTVTHYSIENTKFLLEQGVKAVVVACNTASAYAVPALQEMFWHSASGAPDAGSPATGRTPIIGVLQPGAQAAVAATRSRRIGVIGTAGTIGSGAYENAIKVIDADCQVFSQACPLFVPLVEEGWLDRSETRSIARHYLEPLSAAEVDTVILGCTHYPLLQAVVQDVMGPDVTLVDSAKATAHAVQELLAAGSPPCEGGDKGEVESDHQFFVTDSPERFQRVGEIFLGHALENVEKV